ncbi:MAG: helix-turn-helix domain-containing protein [Dehalococcoidia bacterium]|jgi:excisionase family DNA binding protein|nr:helix-turn-helix domain-containing protein [Dehalococcoidia bacterium]
MDSQRLLLTIPEVASRLGLGRSLVYQLVMKGEISSIKVGRARRVPVTALEQFILDRIALAQGDG